MWPPWNRPSWFRNSAPASSASAGRGVHKFREASTMPLIPIFRLGQQEKPSPPRLTTYIPALSLDSLQVGVDNLRHDVHLSSKFVEQTRLHLTRLLARHGDVEGLIAAEAAQRPGNHFTGWKPGQKSQPEPADLKPLLTELHVVVLNRAKAEGNQVLDLLGRAAILKFLRVEIHSQFAQILERCRMMLKSYEGVRPQRALEYRERVAGVQVAKKIVCHKTGQDLFRLLREGEKETRGRPRRSLFGTNDEEPYKLFLNPL